MHRPRPRTREFAHSPHSRLDYLRLLPESLAPAIRMMLGPLRLRIARIVKLCAISPKAWKPERDKTCAECANLLAPRYTE